MRSPPHNFRCSNTLGARASSIGPHSFVANLLVRIAAALTHSNYPRASRWSQR